jgi:hypothetical protein
MSQRSLRLPPCGPSRQRSRRAIALVRRDMATQLHRFCPVLHRHWYSGVLGEAGGHTNAGGRRRREGCSRARDPLAPCLQPPETGPTDAIPTSLEAGGQPTPSGRGGNPVARQWLSRATVHVGHLRYAYVEPEHGAMQSPMFTFALPSRPYLAGRPPKKTRPPKRAPKPAEM